MKVKLKQLDVDQEDEIKAKLTQYALVPKGYLLLVGPNGTGRTYAAKAILHHQKLYDSDDYQFITQSELNSQWKHQLAEWKDDLYLLDQYKRYKFLILDDIGTRIPSPAFGDFIYAIIDKRCNNYQSTVITTNLNSSQMRERFGDAITSRVASGMVIRFKGKDRRINW